jgi:hypothetical protein
MCPHNFAISRFIPSSISSHRRVPTTPYAVLKQYPGTSTSGGRETTQAKRSSYLLKKVQPERAVQELAIVVAAKTRSASLQKKQIWSVESVQNAIGVANLCWGPALPR